ncbi:MAG: uracil-xanthine permease family protein [Mangrovibacterium sp.]
MKKEKPQHSRASILLLGFQHVLAMFGATVLVPALTGLNPSIALFTAGVGTLLFHWVTKFKVPSFLGSSFAFIGAISLVLQQYGIAEVKGGIIAAGLVYVAISALVKFWGINNINRLFPPIVVGPTIIVIGLRLAPIAVNNALYVDGAFSNISLLISLSVILTMIICSVIDKSFFRLVPILTSVIVGYMVAAFCGVLNVEAIYNAPWMVFSDESVRSTIFTMPAFSWSSVLAIAPIALVVFMEHIGDIKSNGEVVGKDFVKDPGLHRTILGDGLATIFAGIVGGPANTTYGENTGVLAVTKNYNPFILRVAAVMAILLSFFGKFGVAISNIPLPVMGGISVILFGMISAIGVRTMVNAQLDFGHSRNLIIASVILVAGIGIGSIPMSGSVEMSGLTIAAFMGVLLNVVLPKDI